MLLTNVFETQGDSHKKKSLSSHSREIESGLKKKPKESPKILTIFGTALTRLALTSFNSDDKDTVPSTHNIWV